MARGPRPTSRRCSRRDLADPQLTAVQPTDAPVEPANLAGTLSRNIEAVARRRAEDAANASRGVRIASRIGRIIGRMRFVYANLAFYGGWTALHYGVIPGATGFDHGLALMGSIASAEGIFLSLFILIAQNTASTSADRRDDLSLQVGLLAEHEITQLIKVTAAIAARLGIDAEHHGEIADLKQDIQPEAVLDKIAAEEPPVEL